MLVLWQSGFFPRHTRTKPRRALGLPLRSSPAIAAAALKLAIEKNHPVYDMLYIALAEESACKFVTADEVLIEKLGSAFPCLLWLGDL